MGLSSDATDPIPEHSAMAALTGVAAHVIKRFSLLDRNMYNSEQICIEQSPIEGYVENVVRYQVAYFAGRALRSIAERF